MIKETPNLDYLEQLAAGDSRAKQAIFEVMVNEFTDDYAAYLNAKSENDFKKSITFVHRLKHKVGFLGMEYSYQVAHRHEDELRRNSHRFTHEFDAILEQIQEFITTKPSL